MSDTTESNELKELVNRIDGLHLSIMELQYMVGTLMKYEPGSTAEKAHRNLGRLLELIRRSDELMAEHNHQ